MKQVLWREGLTENQQFGGILITNSKGRPQLCELEVYIYFLIF